jgi:hypothetical protein
MPGTPQMVAQRADVDAHERYAEQEKDRFGDKRPEQLSGRRHGDADEHQGCDGARALAAEPRQRPYRDEEDALEGAGHSVPL